MQYDWLSAHIFYKGGADELLCRVVQPFINQVLPLLHVRSPWFYIRYVAGGPHIRLRLHTNKNHLVRLKEQLEHATTNVVYVPYEREIKRYGNQTTIALAEEQFFSSSACSLSFISATPYWNTQTALGIAWQMHIAFFHALDSDVFTIRTICGAFIASWIPVLTNNHDAAFQQITDHMHMLYNRQAISLQTCAAALWQSLDTRQAPAPLQAYADRSRSLLQQYREAGLDDEQLRYAIRSLLHMTHNRLGISNREEAWCIFITDRCIKYIYEHAY
jgi:thiopeptide-type bacteriocin biosynthesis protein